MGPAWQEKNASLPARKSVRPETFYGVERVRESSLTAKQGLSQHREGEGEGSGSYSNEQWSRQGASSAVRGMGF